MTNKIIKITKIKLLTLIVSTLMISVVSAQPIVDFDTINFKIDNNTDGLIKIYIQNPYNIPLNLDIYASTHSGLNIFSDIFSIYEEIGQYGRNKYGTNKVAGNIIALPGQNRTDYVYIRSENNEKGVYLVELYGEYYTEGYLEGRNPISQKILYKHTFIVNPSANNNVNLQTRMFAGIYEIKSVLDYWIKR